MIIEPSVGSVSESYDNALAETKGDHLGKQRHSSDE